MNFTGVLEYQLGWRDGVPGAVATGAQASLLAITRRRDNAATGTVALQSYPVATAPGTDSID